MAFTFIRITSIVLISTITATAITSLHTFTVWQWVYGDCIQDEDWPDKPCLDTPPYSREYLLQVWEKYYEFKGKEWMDLKRMEMDREIQNGTLRQWVEIQNAPNNFANHNVWYYYYLNGEAPDAYGPQPTTSQLEKCRELGIDITNCNDATILAKGRTNPDLPLSDETIKQMQEQQNQINNSIYMIGVGSAIAGVIAFLTLHRRNQK